MKVEFNKDRISYLLALYKMSIDDLLSLLNMGKKRLVNVTDLTGDIIDLNLLKRIDKVFQKGILFYMDFSELRNNRNSSVFFRKSEFGTQLNMESMRIVHKFESLKHTLDGYNILSHFNVDSQLKKCTIKAEPSKIAEEVRRILLPTKRCNTSRSFLVELISMFSENNIFVFEFIETWNKKEKTNIDGVFIKPNLIVLKHHKHYKREIFTLVHELGHLLLDVEEVEDVDLVNGKMSNDIERWCNEFAFYFLLGDDYIKLLNVSRVNSTNDYCMDVVQDLSDNHFVSRLAIYTHLYLHNKMSYATYEHIKKDLEQQYQNKIVAEQQSRDQKNIYVKPPKPILSPLMLRTMQMAFFNGIVNEAVFCNRLNINPTQFEHYLWK